MSIKSMKKCRNAFIVFAVFLSASLLVSDAGAQLDIIKSISPSSADQGTAFKLSITLDESLGTPPVPPSEVVPVKVELGTIEGSNISRNNFVITADFTISAEESGGKKDVTVVFLNEVQEEMSFIKSSAFEVLSSGETGSLTVAILPAEAVNSGAKWNVDGGAWQNSGAEVSGLTTGIHTVSFRSVSGWNAPGSQIVSITAEKNASITGTCIKGVIPTVSYPVIDTGQIKCYDNSVNISCPQSGASFYGQDAQYTGNAPNYTDKSSSTVIDNNTGLMWQKSPDTDGDGDIDAADKLSWSEIQAYPAALNAQNFGGYSDWRVPTIKELYSLIKFRGSDPSGYEGIDTSGLTPFIDTDCFDFAYGDTSAGERIIDAQYASDTLYISNDGGSKLFGVNFADGRIKGYGLSLFDSDKKFFLICVRGSTAYGLNNFTDNGDNTITDNATGLMWSQADSGTAMNWQESLAWVEQKNAENYLAHNDWRLPNAKELQSIVDYTRSPDTSNSAAIDPVFSTTSITNEAGKNDYPFYWANSTHAAWNGMGGYAVYVAFGRAMGYMNGSWVDVHGAGAQRSDPKSGDPGDYPTGHGPQGDAIRIYNYVRLVRNADLSTYNYTLNDVIIILKILSGIPVTEEWADAVIDGKAAITDAIAIIREVAEL